MTPAQRPLLSDRQLPIEREILSALISATPEAWSQISLVVDITWFEGYEDIFADITSPQGHDAAAAPVTEAVFAAITRLFLLIKEHGFRLKSIRGHAWLDEKGRWMYRSKYEYMPDEETT